MLEETGTKVSISTVKQILYRHNLKGRSARKKPLLQNHHKKAQTTVYTNAHGDKDRAFLEKCQGIFFLRGLNVRICEELSLHTSPQPNTLKLLTSTVYGDSLVPKIRGQIHVKKNVNQFPDLSSSLRIYIYRHFRVVTRSIRSHCFL